MERESESPSSQPLRQSRRSHLKTRTGCKTCKRRKIKCDEGRPACRNCIKHAVKCDFAQLEPPQTPDRPLSTHGNALNMLDLELLHNYTISTYATLANAPELRQLWRVTVPQVSLGCDYVMRSVLAVSALHMAFHRPDKRDFYTTRALEYHQLASRTAMDLMGNVAVDDAENLFLFSILTIYVALASPRKLDGSLLIGETSYPEWMALLQGTKALVSLLGNRAQVGPLSPLFLHGTERWLAMHPEMNPSPWQDPNRPAAQYSPPPPLQELQAYLDKTALDETRRKAHNSAVKELTASFRSVETSAHMEMTDAFVWIWEVADDFLPLVAEPTQEAVAIFAHFCVLLKKLENQWWLRGWAEHLIARSYQILDTQHRLWVRWPVEEIGWVAP